MQRTESRRRRSQGSLSDLLSEAQVESARADGGKGGIKHLEANHSNSHLVQNKNSNRSLFSGISCSTEGSSMSMQDAVSTSTAEYTIDTEGSTEEKKAPPANQSKENNNKSSKGTINSSSKLLEHLSAFHESRGSSEDDSYNDSHVLGGSSMLGGVSDDDEESSTVDSLPDTRRNNNRTSSRNAMIGTGPSNNFNDSQKSFGDEDTASFVDQSQRSYMTFEDESEIDESMRSYNRYNDESQRSFMDHSERSFLPEESHGSLFSQFTEQESDLDYSSSQHSARPIPDRGRPQSRFPPPLSKPALPRSTYEEDEEDDEEEEMKLFSGAEKADSMRATDLGRGNIKDELKSIATERAKTKMEKMLSQHRLEAATKNAASKTLLGDTESVVSGSTTATSETFVRARAELEETRERLKPLLNRYGCDENDEEDEEDEDEDESNKTFNSKQQEEIAPGSRQRTAKNDDSNKKISNPNISQENLVQDKTALPSNKKEDSAGADKAPPQAAASSSTAQNVTGTPAPTTALNRAPGKKVDYYAEQKKAQEQTKAQDYWQKLRIALTDSKAQNVVELQMEISHLKQILWSCRDENEDLLQDGQALFEENEALQKEVEQLKLEAAAADEKIEHLTSKVEDLEYNLEAAELHSSAPVMDEGGNDWHGNGPLNSSNHGSVLSGTSGGAGAAARRMSQAVSVATSVMSKRASNDAGTILGNGSGHGNLPPAAASSSRRHSASLDTVTWTRDDYKMAYEHSQSQLSRKNKLLDQERQKSIASFKEQQKELELLQDVTHFAVQQKKDILAQKKKCEKIIKACSTCKPLYTQMLQQQQLEEQERKNALLLKQMQETALSQQAQQAKMKQQQQLLASTSATAAMRQARRASSIHSQTGANRGSGMTAAGLLGLNKEMFQHDEEEPVNTSGGADPLAKGALKMRARRMSTFTLPKNLGGETGGKEGEHDDGIRASSTEDKRGSGGSGAYSRRGPRNGLTLELLQELQDLASEDEDEDEDEEDEADEKIGESTKVDENSDSNNPSSVMPSDPSRSNIKSRPRNGISAELLEELQALAESENDMDSARFSEEGGAAETSKNGESLKDDGARVDTVVLSKSESLNIDSHEAESEPTISTQKTNLHVGSTSTSLVTSLPSSRTSVSAVPIEDGPSTSETGSGASSTPIFKGNLSATNTAVGRRSDFCNRTESLKSNLLRNQVMERRRSQNFTQKEESRIDEDPAHASSKNDQTEKNDEEFVTKESTESPPSQKDDVAAPDEGSSTTKTKTTTTGELQRDKEGGMFLVLRRTSLTEDDADAAPDDASALTANTTRRPVLSNPFRRLGGIGRRSAPSASSALERDEVLPPVIDTRDSQSSCGDEEKDKKLDGDLLGAVDDSKSSAAKTAVSANRGNKFGTGGLFRRPQSGPSSSTSANDRRNRRRSNERASEDKKQLITSRKEAGDLSEPRESIPVGSEKANTDNEPVQGNDKTKDSGIVKRGNKNSNIISDSGGKPGGGGRLWPFKGKPRQPRKKDDSRHEKATPGTFDDEGNSESNEKMWDLVATPKLSEEGQDLVTNEDKGKQEEEEEEKAKSLERQISLDDSEVRIGNLEQQMGLNKTRSSIGSSKGPQEILEPVDILYSTNGSVEYVDATKKEITGPRDNETNEEVLSVDESNLSDSSSASVSSSSTVSDSEDDSNVNNDDDESSSAMPYGSRGDEEDSDDNSEATTTTSNTSKHGRRKRVNPQQGLKKMIRGVQRRHQVSKMEHPGKSPYYCGSSY